MAKTERRESDEGKMKLYMEVTQDALSLPLAVAESAAELAELRGVARHTIDTGIWKGRNRKHPKYIVIEVEEEE